MLYFSDVDICGAPTTVVPVQNWPRGEGYELTGARPHDARVVFPDVRPDLYGRERAVRFRPGTALLWHHGVFHRGTATIHGRQRLISQFVYRRADSPWVMYTSIAYDGQQSKTLAAQRFYGELGVGQRDALGFPPVGSKYWTAETINAVARRFPHMDMGPYSRGMAAAAATTTAATMGDAKL